MFLGIIVPKLSRYPHRLGYNNKMCWHLLANAARSTMRKSRISKVLPHPPFTSFTFPITPDPSRISTAQEAGSDFSCLLPASSSFVCRPFHVAFHANVAIFFLQQQQQLQGFPLFVLLQPSYRENFKFSHSQFAVTNANDAPPTSYTIKKGNKL